MKKISIIFSFLLLVISCAPFEDDLVSQECIDNCTKITGELATLGGSVPIRNVLVRARWTDFGTGDGPRVTREKAVAEVDSNGNFSLQFEVRDDEINQGSYFLRFYLDSNEFYTTSGPIGTFRNYYIREDNSSLINAERHYKYLIPKRGRIAYELENPEAMDPSDRLRLNFKVLYDTTYQIPISGLVTGLSTDITRRETDFVAGEPLAVQIERENDGNLVIEHDTITIPVWQDTFVYRVRF